MRHKRIHFSIGQLSINQFEHNKNNSHSFRFHHLQFVNCVFELISRCWYEINQMLGGIISIQNFIATCVLGVSSNVRQRIVSIPAFWMLVPSDGEMCIFLWDSASSRKVVTKLRIPILCGMTAVSALHITDSIPTNNEYSAA